MACRSMAGLQSKLESLVRTPRPTATTLHAPIPKPVTQPSPRTTATHLDHGKSQQLHAQYENFAGSPAPPTTTQHPAP
eukprot:365827-Chlamydomonas_euryale.AAC.4